MSDMQMSGQKISVGGVVGRVISYVVFISWAIITIIPLFWMFYSSFKSNEELSIDIYKLPIALFDNAEDEYMIIAPQLNVIIPDEFDEYDPATELFIIESTTIAPTRRLMVHVLLKDDIPREVANLDYGDIITLDQLPRKISRDISWKTVWFNYSKAIERGGLLKKLWNSLLYVFVATSAMIFLGLMMGFGLSKLKFKRLSKVVAGLIGLGYLIDITSVIIPLFLMLNAVKLTDTHLGIILVYTAFGLPIAVMLIKQFMDGLPNSLIESAEIDGASTFRTFWSIITPMCKPVIVTIAIIQGLGIWNEFLLVLVMASSEATKSLPVGVYSFSSLTSTQLGWQLAALVLATLPVVLLFAFFNKRLTEGVMGGALKG